MQGGGERKFLLHSVIRGGVSGKVTCELRLDG